MYPFLYEALMALRRFNKIFRTISAHDGYNSGYNFINKNGIERQNFE